MNRLIIFLLIPFICLPAICQGQDIYEDQLNSGIRNAVPQASLLIEQSKGNPVSERQILHEALRYAPDLPAVYFEMAKARLNFKPEELFEAVDYMLQGIAAYERNFWWAFSMASSLIMSLIISFLVSVSVIILIRLSRDLPLLSHDIMENRLQALLLLVLIFAILGPLYLLFGLLIIAGFYMKPWDRIVLYLYLIFLLMTPFVLKVVSMVLSAPSSGELRAIVEVNEASGNKYALSLLKDSTNNVELFSYALALKREGRYHESKKIYEKLVDVKPDPRIFNNLANCFVALGDLEKAKELYMKSNAITSVPSVLYNLSQVYRETFDFDKGEEYFLSAQRLDNRAVSAYRAIVSRNPNRFVIDEGLPASVILNYAKSKMAGVTSMGLSTVPVHYIPVIAIVMGTIFFLLDRWLKNRAYRCKRCGKILCSRCEKHILWGHMCLQCYRSIVKLDELDAKERIARILTVYEFRKKQRNIIKLLTLFVPGSGLIYAGSVLYGLLFLWSFLFFLFIPVMNSLFITGMTVFSHVWLNIVAAVFLIIIYFLSNAVTRRRLAKGWL